MPRHQCRHRLSFAWVLDNSAPESLGPHRGKRGRMLVIRVRYEGFERVEVFRWKTGGRGILRLRRNTNADIEDALRLAVCAQTERAAVAVLCGFYGINVPVASALLMAINPEPYTIIDFRAVESLGISDYNPTVDYYLVYLADLCTNLS